MNLDNLSTQLLNTIIFIKLNLNLALLIVSCLWVIQFINASTHYQLNYLGLYPRYIIGLRGIIFSPFLHGSFSHLFFNSIPLVFLIDFMLLYGVNQFIYVSSIILLLSGFATWLFGRKALHIGASHLVMGYWGYLLINAYQHPSVITIMLAILCIYYFGGLLLSLFPVEAKTSWEGHIFGFLAGIAATYL